MMQMYMLSKVAEQFLKHQYPNDADLVYELKVYPHNRIAIYNKHTNKCLFRGRIETKDDYEKFYQYDTTNPTTIVAQEKLGNINFIIYQDLIDNNDDL